MSDKLSLLRTSPSGSTEPKHPEVLSLMSRLQDITPKELAQALFHLEIKKELPQLYLQLPPQIVNHTQLYFSRGIKKEMESIYLELAKHLEVKSRGSVDLMNHVFELLQKTLNSLVEVPHFISMN